jgi:hypothetical protein
MGISGFNSFNGTSTSEMAQAPRPSLLPQLKLDHLRPRRWLVWPFIYRDPEDQTGSAIHKHVQTVREKWTLQDTIRQYVCVGNVRGVRAAKAASAAAGRALGSSPSAISKRKPSFELQFGPLSLSRWCDLPQDPVRGESVVLIVFHSRPATLSWQKKTIQSVERQ